MITELRMSLIRDVKRPARAHDDDAGIDFFVPNDWNDGHPKNLNPNERLVIPSGVRVDVPKGYALIGHNKSGISSKQGLLRLAEVVDAGYQGEVQLVITNVSDRNVFIAPGMKLMQFILMPIETPIVKIVDEDFLYKTKSSRGEGKFGSTDAKEGK